MMQLVDLDYSNNILVIFVMQGGSARNHMVMRVGELGGKRMRWYSKRQRE